MLPTGSSNPTIHLTETGTFEDDRPVYLLENVSTIQTISPQQQQQQLVSIISFFLFHIQLLAQMITGPIFVHVYNNQFFSQLKLI